MPEAQSLAGQAGIVAGEEALAMPPDSPILNAMAHMPTIAQTASWNALRGVNTITGGGFASQTTQAGMVNNHLNPKSWTRFSGTDVFNQSNATLSPFKGDKGQYSMFNFISRGSNAGISRLAKGKHTGEATRNLLKKWGIQATEYGSGERAWVGNYLSPGMYSNHVASRKISGMSASKFAKAKPNVLNYIKGSDKEFFSKFGSALPGKGLEAASQTQIAEATSMLPRGVISQKMGGYVAGTRGISSPALTAGKAAGREIFTQSALNAQAHLGLGGFTGGEKMGPRNLVKGIKTAYRGKGANVLAGKSTQGIFGAADDVVKGVSKASKALGKVGRVARFGGAVGARYGSSLLGGPAAPAILTAMMVVDLIKMGGSLAAAGGKLAKDSAISLKGSIDKPVMGMGFKDNTVAATSRQRGVMAIQNSKLNARSVLGSEAAMMHASFG